MCRAASATGQLLVSWDGPPDTNPEPAVIDGGHYSGAPTTRAEPLDASASGPASLSFRPCSLLERWVGGWNRGPGDAWDFRQRVSVVTCRRGSSPPATGDRGRTWVSRGQVTSILQRHSSTWFSQMHGMCSHCASLPHAMIRWLLWHMAAGFLSCGETRERS